MSTVIASKEGVKARKKYRCVLCGETIALGEIHEEATASGVLTGPATGVLTLSQPPQREVLRIKRPYIKLKNTNTFIICVSPDEWAILEKAYSDQICNTDKSSSLVFMAEVEENTK